jgi:hypothetical protein
MEDLTRLEEFVIDSCMKAAGREGWQRFSMYWTLPYVFNALSRKNINLPISLLNGEMMLWWKFQDQPKTSYFYWHLMRDGVEIDFDGQLDTTKIAIAKLLGYKPEKLSNCCASAIQPETDICSQCQEHCEAVEV